MDKTLAERLREAADYVEQTRGKENTFNVSATLLREAADALDRITPPDAGVGLAYRFDRYINGQRMAEGVKIEREKTLGAAMEAAARIASRGAHGEVPVLVFVPTPPDAGVGLDAMSPSREKIFGAIRAFTSATIAEAEAATAAVIRIANNTMTNVLQPRCQHCNDTGFVAIRATTGIYLRPGPVPCDARGVAEAPCWECTAHPGGFDGPTGAD